MKKVVHYIISYLGAACFSCGLLGCVFKWGAKIFSYTPSTTYIECSIFLSILVGLTFTICCYHPKKIK